ncbi:hypothetical protein TNIN_295881 [Trichonephila inaurata madagascariensis]|uniref:Uncharacterized protein n=1 Tax=Trichonephila inaurata madagascariensis TaxID=2747483 RepID=A0A8X6Y5Z5_9ARAC|nr:hypothetical protein TNIN_295881 [Trichonephila inaurata madagascariensis]
MQKIVFRNDDGLTSQPPERLYEQRLSTVTRERGTIVFSLPKSCENIVWLRNVNPRTLSFIERGEVKPFHCDRPNPKGFFFPKQKIVCSFSRAGFRRGENNGGVRQDHPRIEGGRKLDWISHYD